MEAEFDWVVGRILGHVFTDENECRWIFPLGDDAQLQVGCQWQIIAEGRVALASGDHGQMYGLPTAMDAVSRASHLVAGRGVRSVTLAFASSELELELDGEVWIRTFNDSSGYEGWEIQGPGKRYGR